MNSSASRSGPCAVVACALLVLALLAPRAHSQLVNDGETNVLDNVTNIITGDVTVGTNASFTLLSLVNGTFVTNSGTGSIGLAAGAHSNSVWLAGSGTRWHLASDLKVGIGGSWNRVVVSNGATVENSVGFVGSGSSSNEVVVTGAGSFWNNRSQLFVGGGGSGNRLVISNGGLVGNNDGAIDSGFNVSNNGVFVTGAGSVWSNRGWVLIGVNLSANGLAISDGGLVRSYQGFIGANPSSSKNEVLVTGAYSFWSNQNRLYVGYGGRDNRLKITEGGTVFASNGVYLSYVASGLGYATNNRIINSGGNLIVRNGTGTGEFDIRNGTNIFDSGLIDVDQLVMTNTAGFFEFNGGTLITRGATISNGQDFVVGAAAGFAPATWDVRSNALPTTVANRLFIGSNAPNASLLITNGGTLTVAGGSSIGGNASSTNNLVVVSGPGSAWNSDNLIVGSGGSGNTLLISDGGRVSNRSATIGSQSTASNNTVIVTGPNSIWTNSGNSIFTVGSGGAGNTLIISNGGMVASYLGYVGTGSESNLAIVTGANSVWTNRGSLSVGGGESIFDKNNTLIISNGGRADSVGGIIGYHASNNHVIVTGPGSIWDNGTGPNGAVLVGFGDVGNTLLVADQGTFKADVLSVATAGNMITVNNGTVITTNAAGTGTLAGKITFNDGNITTDRLLLRDANDVFGFSAGTINARSASAANGSAVAVGDGKSAATYRMTGVGTNVHSFANGLVISTNATLTGSGAITGSVTNYGNVAPGSSPGKITINGDLRFLPSATATFELGGVLASNQYDQIEVTNFVQFAGTLSLALLNNFLPGPADTFTLVSFNSSSGIFNNAINGLRVSFATNLASFHVSYDTNLVLSDVQYADNDGDGAGDLQEIAAGTDPADAASKFAILSLGHNGAGHFVVRFQSVAGKSYRVEYSDDLVTWNVATGASILPSGLGASEWADDGTLTGGLSATARFYRIGLQ